VHGIHDGPEAVDYSDPALPPGMDAKKIQAGIEQGLKKITDRGWQADVCLIQPDATAGPAMEQRLGATTYDCVVTASGLWWRVRRLEEKRNQCPVIAMK
jgi:hypothetical protein